MISPTHLVPDATATRMKVESTLLHREAAEAADTVARQLERNGAVVRKLAAGLRDHAPPIVATYTHGSSDHATN